MAQVMQTQPSAQATQSAPAGGMQGKPMDGQEKKGSKWLMWVIIVLVLVVLGIGIWFWIF